MEALKIHISSLFFPQNFLDKPCRQASTKLHFKATEILVFLKAGFLLHSQAIWLCMKPKSRCVFTHAKNIKYLFWWIQGKISQMYLGLNLGWHNLLHSYSKTYQSRKAFIISDFHLLPKNLNIFKSCWFKMFFWRRLHCGFSKKETFSFQYFYRNEKEDMVFLVVCISFV